VPYFEQDAAGSCLRVRVRLIEDTSDKECDSLLDG